MEGQPLDPAAARALADAVEATAAWEADHVTPEEGPTTSLEDFLREDVPALAALVRALLSKLEGQG